MDATSYCLGDGVNGQVSNAGSWNLTRELNPDTYTVNFDPSKLLIQSGQNLHIGGYEIEYGSQSSNFGLRFTALAAEPEADTWAMLLADLGLVGISARRRKQRHIRFHPPCGIPLAFPATRQGRFF